MDIDRVIRTAQENICKGIIVEPRWFWDEILLPDNTTAQAFSRGDAFKNGEDYPMLLKHLVLGIQDDGADERLIQHVGLRLTFHGQDYMGRQFLPAPLWHTRPSAAPNLISFGQSSIQFDQPFVLSSRDTLQVKVQLTGVADTERTLAVSFTGYGLQSRRPYFKSGQVATTDIVQHVIASANYRNDGDEPVVITDMSLYCSSQEDDNNPQGDIRAMRVQVKQIGNGTEAVWMTQAPTLPNDMMPAMLTGLCTGRVVVHDFPGDGLLWEPGEGLQVQMMSQNGDVNEETVAIALVGTIKVI